jgi:pyrophosphatase PpaX
VAPQQKHFCSANGALGSAASGEPQFGQYLKVGTVLSSPDHSSRNGNGSIDCILFDLDGTLIDTTDLIFRSYQHAIRAILDRSVSDEELYLGYGQPLSRAFGAILDHQGLTYPPAEYTALVEQLVATYRVFNVAHHDSLAREFPGVRGTLGELVRRGYRLGLVTSKSRTIGRQSLDLIGAGPEFETMVFMEDSERHKPHPDPVFVALNRLRLREHANRAIFVGDSTHDLRAGRAAGVQTGAAMWGPFPPDSLLALGPDHVLPSIESILDLCPVRDGSMTMPIRNPF